MIPEFNEHGNLPSGIHTARLLEVVARFGRQSELRRVQAESLAWLVELAGKAGVTRIVINGSFVTARLEPNDVDCALLIGAGYPADKAAAAELASGLPFLDLQIVGQTAVRPAGWAFFRNRPAWRCQRCG